MPYPLEPSLVFSDLFVELSVDGLSSGSVDEILAFIDKLPLGPQDGELPNDILCRFGGVVVLDHQSVLVKDRSEEFTGELLTTFVGAMRVFFPHVGDKNGISQRRVAAKLKEHVEISSSDSSKPSVRNEVDVDDTGKLQPFVVSVKKFNEKSRTMMWTYVVAKKAAIICTISVSLFEVSSNPGVSMRTTFLPLRVNRFGSWTLAVHDSKPIPTRRFEPLTRLMS